MDSAKCYLRCLPSKRNCSLYFLLNKVLISNFNYNVLMLIFLHERLMNLILIYLSKAIERMFDLLP